jgi:hypothetical protein
VGQRKIPNGKKVRRKGHKGIIYTVGPWSEAVSKYQLQLDGNPLSEWVPEEELEVVEEPEPTEQVITIVPDPIVGPEPQI